MSKRSSHAEVGYPRWYGAVAVRVGLVADTGPGRPAAAVSQRRLLDGRAGRQSARLSDRAHSPRAGGGSPSLGTAEVGDAPPGVEGPGQGTAAGPEELQEPRRLATDQGHGEQPGRDAGLRP